VDPKPTVGESEYAVNKNNPVLNNDPDGDCADCPKPSFSVSFRGSISSKGKMSFSAGAAVGMSYTKGDMMLAMQASGRLYGGGLGSTGIGDVQGDLVLSGSATFGSGKGSGMALNTFNSLTPSAITNEFRGSVTLASNFVFNTSGRNQRVGSIGFRIGDVTGNMYNDFFGGLGDKNDRWWTGGFTGEVGLGGGNSLSFGSEAFTGERRMRRSGKTDYVSGNREFRLPYYIKQIGDRGYYQQSSYRYNNGQTFIQLNTSNGMMIRANVIGGKDALWQQNMIHDNYPSHPIPRFKSLNPSSLEINIGAGSGN
jgi:hypothetical protein